MKRIMEVRVEMTRGKDGDKNGNKGRDKTNMVPVMIKMVKTTEVILLMMEVRVEEMLEAHMELTLEVRMEVTLEVRIEPLPAAAGSQVGSVGGTQP